MQNRMRWTVINFHLLKQYIKKNYTSLNESEKIHLSL